ncbi:MAG: hypothetical protein H0W01_11580 [Pseudonocardiales bacterium]|nr:hypothetical protein [Pseudonocardiales bacterium]
MGSVGADLGAYLSTMMFTLTSATFAACWPQLGGTVLAYGAALGACADWVRMFLFQVVSAGPRRDPGSGVGAGRGLVDLLGDHLGGVLQLVFGCPAAQREA